MNVAIFLCPISQISGLELDDYDVVLGPENISALAKKQAPEFGKIVPTTSESSLEASILRSELDRICEPLEGLFGKGSAPIVKRGLYLSAVKNELRLLIDAKKKLGPMPSSIKKVHVFYTYSTFPELFRDEQFNVRWFHCPRIALGRISFLFRLLEKVRPFCYTQSQI